MNNIPVKHKGENLAAVFNKYQNNDRTAILLVDAETGELWTVATVNVPEENISDDEVIIKDWSENEGITDALIDAGIIEEPHDMVICGLVVADICKLKIKPTFTV